MPKYSQCAASDRRKLLKKALLTDPINNAIANPLTAEDDLLGVVVGKSVIEEI